jgi:YVTN family beta-propeller protein
MIYSIPLEGVPVAVNKKNGYVYAIKYKAAAYPDATGVLYLIQGTEVIKRVGFVGKFPFQFAVNSETGYFYVARNSCPVCLYIPPYTRFLQTVKDDELSVKVPVGQIPWGIGLEPTTGLIYVANYLDNFVSVIQEASNIGTIIVGSDPMKVAVNPNNGKVYVTLFDGIAVIEGKELVATLPRINDGTYYQIAVEPNSGYVYGGTTNTINVFDGLDLIGNIGLPEWLHELTADPKNGLIYALMFDKLAVIQDITVIAEIPVGRNTDDTASKYTVAVDPERGLVYVTSYLDNKLTIIGEIE